MHGFDGGEILVHDIVKIAASLFYIPDNAAKDAFVGICLNVNFNVQQIPYPRISKEKDSFYYDDFFRFNADGAVGTIVLAIIIDRAIHGLTVF